MQGLSTADVVSLTNKPLLAAVYFDGYVNDRSNIETATELNVSATAVQDARGELTEMGLMRDGQTVPVSISLHDVTVGPSFIGLVGKQLESDAVSRFLSRQGAGKLLYAVHLTDTGYLDGSMTRRMIARKLDVPPVEGIAITQEAEPLIETSRDNGS